MREEWALLADRRDLGRHGWLGGGVPLEEPHTAIPDIQRRGQPTWQISNRGLGDRLMMVGCSLFSLWLGI